MIHLPESVMHTYWCPKCGRQEIAHQVWHIPFGELTGRCSGVMRRVEYACTETREAFAGEAADAS